MKYLVPEPRKRHHSVVSHILADDEETALCVVSTKKPGIYHPWPRVMEGDWKIADEPIGAVCLRCTEAKRKAEAPPASPKPKVNWRIVSKRDLDKLAKWNAMANGSHS